VTGEPGEPSEQEALWRFSLAFYAFPGVAEALITLQDQRGFDVNLILFALWLGISGRGALGIDLLVAARATTGTLQSEIIEPLRSLRRKLRYHPDDDVQQLREGVKALELASEKAAQARLARLRVRARADASLEDRLAVAHGNFALYLDAEGMVDGPEAAAILRALDAYARPRDRTD
jgi:uncharacterized protein (TIGR02444 family)